MQSIAGYKTYIVAAAMAIYAVAMFWQGSESQADMIKLLFAAASVAGLRSGLTTTLSTVLTGMGLPVPPSASTQALKEIAKTALPTATKIAPVILALFLIAPMLSACANTPALTPQQTLQAVEAGFAIAEATYDAICSVNAPPSFCTDAADQANYAKAKVALEAAFQTAQAAITASGNLDSASIEALLNAVSQDWAAYNQIVNTVQQKNATRLGIVYRPIPLN